MFSVKLSNFLSTMNSTFLFYFSKLYILYIAALKFKALYFCLSDHLCLVHYTGYPQSTFCCI